MLRRYVTPCPERREVLVSVAYSERAWAIHGRALRDEIERALLPFRPKPEVTGFRRRPASCPA